jgi:hypothetical protein
LAVIFVLVAAAHAEATPGQRVQPATQEHLPQLQWLQPPLPPPAPSLLLGSQAPSSIALPLKLSSASQLLIELNDPNIKFRLERLMNILRDSRHEGWVLSAYPDPKTGQPLIGAGFNLDVMASQHVQRNPLNHHLFLEPSARELWEAAKLDPARLQNILDLFDRDVRAWNMKKFRQKIRAHELPPELTQEEATRLLRISALEAIHNARAYCDDFDGLTASQQMALSQLVFQMGVHLEEFAHFLSAINRHAGNGDPAEPIETRDEHWRFAQRTLVETDWARRYSSRAITVIAMFDPDYDRDAWEAEREVREWIHPLVAHHRRRPRAGSLRAVKYRGHISRGRAGKHQRPHNKRS